MFWLTQGHTEARNASVSLYQQLSHAQSRFSNNFTGQGSFITCMPLACDKGASGWLNPTFGGWRIFPDKEEFRDALALRYNKYVPDLPSGCSCGNPSNPSHTMDCKKGGIVQARHDNLRNSGSPIWGGQRYCYRATSRADYRGSIQPADISQYRWRNTTGCKSKRLLQARPREKCIFRY